MRGMLIIWKAGWGYGIWFIWVSITFHLALLPVALVIRFVDEFMGDAAWDVLTTSLVTALSLVYLPYALGIMGALARHVRKEESYKGTIDRVYCRGSYAKGDRKKDLDL